MERSYMDEVISKTLPRESAGDADSQCDSDGWSNAVHLYWNVATQPIDWAELLNDV